MTWLWVPSRVGECFVNAIQKTQEKKEGVTATRIGYITVPSPSKRPWVLPDARPQAVLFRGWNSTVYPFSGPGTSPLVTNHEWSNWGLTLDGTSQLLCNCRSEADLSISLYHLSLLALNLRFTASVPDSWSTPQTYICITKSLKGVENPHPWATRYIDPLPGVESAMSMVELLLLTQLLPLEEVKYLRYWCRCYLHSALQRCSCITAECRQVLTLCIQAGKQYTSEQGNWVTRNHQSNTDISPNSMGS